MLLPALEWLLVLVPVLVPVLVMLCPYWLQHHHIPFAVGSVCNHATTITATSAAATHPARWLYQTHPFPRTCTAGGTRAAAGWWARLALLRAAVSRGSSQQPN